MAAQFPGQRLLACFFTFLSLCLWPSPYGLAQTAAPDMTAALAPDTPTPEHRDLKAGPVNGRVTVLRSSKPFPVGGSAFATIEVSAQGKTKLSGTELVFAADKAEIRSVTGTAVSVDGAGSAHIAKIEKTPKGGKVRVVVELALAGDASGDNSILNVTLRDPAGSNDTTRISWPVIDCASGFYSEIVKVRNNSGSLISDAVKASQTRDSARPGRWLFRPKAVSAARRGKCLKSVKRWSRRHGRFI